MATALEYGVIAAGISVALIAVVNGLAEPEKPVVIPQDYAISTIDKGLKEQVGSVKKNLTGLRTLVFQDSPELQELAFLSCDAPKLQDGKVQIYRYTGTRGRIYFAACP